jgi:hypothetical protein
MPRAALAAVVALMVVAVVVPACNDYTFSPTRHCLVQPGSVQVQLSAVSSADLLFVVDDSPSMDPKQQGLAASFGDFIARMVATNTARAGRGLEPIDFHIAVTTSSVFFATAGAKACVAGASAASCCTPTACTDVASCTPGTSGGCGGGQVCTVAPVLDATQRYVTGARAQCCTPTSCTPATSACVPGDRCGTVSTSYQSPLPPSTFCTPGIASPGAAYPAGAFVGAPAVLDFPKTLDWASWGTAAPDPALVQLVNQFRANIRVGSCGSGEEQHLEAGRLAVQRALAGDQPGAPKGTFPHAGAKLVVVFVGDEDDCSSPAGAPLMMAGTAPGADSCVWDKHQPAGAQRELPVSAYAEFFAGLVRQGGWSDLGAAFIVSSAACTDGSYAPADACTGTASCPVTAPAACGAAPVCGGAYAAGERFLALARALQDRGFGVVEGSVCDAYPPSSFGPVLAKIADLAKPIDGLRLPTLPAARAVTALRIVSPSGDTRRVCTEGTDWCFVACDDPTPTPACLAAGTSGCISIAAGGKCLANPGDTYSAEYVGTLPAGGCAVPADCAAALGGKATDWSCAIEQGANRGSCTCGG